MPSADQILIATPFSEWSKKPVFFDTGLAWTQTNVVNDEALDGTRYAYGVSQEGFWFYVELKTLAQEAEFWKLYLGWRATDSTRSTTLHTFASQSVVKNPPICGTPSTPKCPPPDDLDEAIRSLAKDLAGVGASEPDVDAAIRKVRAMLIATASAALDLIAT